MTYENLKEFLERELKELKRLLDTNYWWVVPLKQIELAKHKSFGVVDFYIDYSEIEYKKIEALWNEYLDIYDNMESKEITKDWKKGRKIK